MKTNSIKKLSAMLKAKTAWLFLSVAIAVTFSSCQKDDDDDNQTPSVGKYQKGVFVVNEGPFQNGTGTISFINRDSLTIENNIFDSINNRPLGNIVQSMNVHNSKAYIVVNNADKIEVVNADDFKETGVINGLKLPRYFLPIDNNKAYVSQWGGNATEGSVKVINLNNNTISKTINTSTGAEAMLLHNGKVYVSNIGGFDGDSTITVINASTDAIEATINVGANPTSMVLGSNGNIYVLCSGKYKIDFSSLESKGSLYEINSSNTVVNNFEFASMFSQPSDLTINAAANKMYYSYDGKIYSQDIDASSLQFNVFATRNAYGLGIDKVTDYIYVADAGNFASNGKVLRYNANGSIIDSFTAGIAPNGFFFR
jgi:YVTN family beta-propeller protein